MKSKFILCLLFITGFICHESQAQIFKATELFSRADSLRGQLTSLRTCYDIHYYHLDVKVDIANKFIAGSNLFRFSANEDFQKLQFDLFDNLSVDKIEYNGQSLPFKREHHAVVVDFPQIVTKGKTDSFIVYYSGHPLQATRAPWDGGFDWKKDSKGKPWVATACQGLGASVWWPNKDHQSDEVDSMLISVAVPRGLMNVSNGRLINKVRLKDGYDRFDWKVSNPINNYNIALNIGDYIHFSEVYTGEKGPLDIDYYILRENNNEQKKNHLRKNVQQTLQAFEYWFGPYPFYEDGYKIVETAHLGMEHQSAIAYGNKFQNGYLGEDGSNSGWGMKWDFIVVHESGHEWFGNSMTAADLADMWIHEAFTNYSEALFIDYFYGKEASQAYVNGNRFTIRNDRPLQGPYHVNKSGSVDMYNKGGVIMNMLRTILNDDDRWHSILRGLNSTLYHKQVDYNDIVNYINDHSGHRLSKFFEQYIQYKSLPVLDIKFAANGKIYLRWISEVDRFEMPIHIGKKEEKKELFYISGQYKEINIPGLTKENISVDTFNYYIGLNIQ